ncbi:hypothetical protein H4S07_004491 [Coemansia furcata]|uniref:Uncharacterized protein n=1 Tax=Coemansia furcata TaxID=417177 RepID=A0ACC1L8H0_9FUNG|nr:hypothetical protein H4S07_004491 [Coemansia furcata]
MNTVNGTHTLNTLDVPVTSTYPFVKHVYVNLDLVDVISGKALALLKSSVYSTATFSIVRTVQFAFINNCSGSDECMEHEAVTENLTLFIEALMPMFPRLKTIRIIPGVGDDAIQNNIYAAFVQFVELMRSYNKQSSIEVHWPTHASQSPPIAVAGLSGIYVSNPKDVCVVQALIHKNATTLKSLSIAKTPPSTFINVFETSYGEAVAYPILEKLTISGMSKVPKPKYILEDSPVLLPQLVDLSVKWGHPFHDDVLFRGNNATLKRVILMLDTEFMTILNKFKVFGESRLQHAVLWNNPLGQGVRVEQGRLFCDIALSMASKVPSLTLQGRFPVEPVVDGITQRPVNHNLRRLKLINSTLSFGSLLALIESLPNLNEIGIMKLTLEEAFSEMNPRTLLEHLHTTASFSM